MTTTDTTPTRWRVAEARTRIPADLVPTHDGLCSPSQYRRGCPCCAWLTNDKARWRFTQPGGREAVRAANRKADSMGRKARLYDRLRARTEAEADADFVARWPEGRPCPGCGEVLPAEAFARDWLKTDGRQLRCNRNGCYYRHQRLKRLARLDEHAQSRGLPAGVCGYCLAAPVEHIDHFWPVALGGPDHPDNYVGACPSCNMAKSDRNPFQWLAATFPERLAFFQSLFREDGTPIPLEAAA